MIVLVISFLIDSVSVLVKKDYLGSSTVLASVGTVGRSVGRSTIVRLLIDIRVCLTDRRVLGRSIVDRYTRSTRISVGTSLG